MIRIAAQSDRFSISLVSCAWVAPETNPPYFPEFAVCARSCDLPKSCNDLASLAIQAGIIIAYYEPFDRNSIAFTVHAAVKTAAPACRTVGFDTPVRLETIVIIAIDRKAAASHRIKLMILTI